MEKVTFKIYILSKVYKFYPFISDIAETNGKTLLPSQIKEISDILDKVDIETESSLNPWDMFRGGFLARSLILLLSWITVNIGNYALILSSTKLAGDIVLNYLYIVMAETPVCIILYFTLDGIGRKFMLSFSLTGLGLSAVALALIPKSYTTLILISYLCGEFHSNLLISFGPRSCFKTSLELFQIKLLIESNSTILIHQSPANRWSVVSHMVSVHPSLCMSAQKLKKKKHKNAKVAQK